LSQELRSELEILIEEAVETRLGFGGVEFGAGPVELNRALVDVQQTLSRLEIYLSRAIRLKAKMDRQEAHVRMTWQEAFDKALTKKKANFGSDFTTGKEKSAEANLASFNEARTLRMIQEDQSFATEAVDVVRLHYYGLDKARQDIRKRLDMTQTEYYS
jgi:hypothetical protein